MPEPSESVLKAVTNLDVVVGILLLAVIVFSDKIVKVLCRNYPRLSTKLAETCLLIEARQENFGGTSYYSHTLKQYVKRKKIYELAVGIEYKLAPIVKLIAAAFLYLYMY